jgi:hypothetical protein
LFSPHQLDLLHQQSNNELNQALQQQHLHHHHQQQQQQQQQFQSHLIHQQNLNYNKSSKALSSPVINNITKSNRPPSPQLPSPNSLKKSHNPIASSPNANKTSIFPSNNNSLPLPLPFSGSQNFNNANIAHSEQTTSSNSITSKESNSIFLFFLI